MWFTEFPRLHRRIFPDGHVHAWSERMSMEDLRRDKLYEPFWPGTSDIVWVDFPSRPGGYRKLCLFRTGGERFGERDLALLQLIRPHLYEIDRLARRRRTGVPHLTSREWQVLELAAEGLGNQQIARTLVTSLSTVRKHLEHIYLKTGARSRSAAVAMLMPLRE
jgi:DNA-binding CsgD family transcriptional regulator